MRRNLPPFSISSRLSPPLRPPQAVLRRAQGAGSATRSCVGEQQQRFCTTRLTAGPPRAARGTTSWLSLQRPYSSTATAAAAGAKTVKDALSAVPSAPDMTGKPSATVTSPKDGKDKSDGEIKNSQLMFDSVWNKLKAKYTEERMVFPKEIIWLMGAPGSGKGTNTPFILEARGITASPVVLSDLLDSPEFRVIKAEGGMISDAQVTETLLETLLQDQYRVGALVDGFPRTEIQVDHVSLLYDRMLTLKRQNPQLYPRPVFRSNPPQPPTVATLPPSPESRGA